MFIKAYLRTSTKKQDAKRAKSELVAFASDHSHKIAAFYVENESGAMLKRPQLMQLIDDASDGDVVLVEQFGRLAHFTPPDWNILKQNCQSNGSLWSQKSYQRLILLCNMRIALSL